LIFDAQYLERYSFANRPVGSAVPRTVARADALSELAVMMGIDAGGLQQTVSRFNGFAKSGVDQDFHRGEHQWKLASRPGPRGNGSIGAVEKPPFYGIELHPAGGSSVGLLTDAHARVIHQRRHAIPGLYASGNVAAATEQGIGYQAGLSLAAAMTFSYLAARHMLRTPNQGR
jgi:3-oxosteroid 1-dehydrogenase